MTPKTPTATTRSRKTAKAADKPRKATKPADAKVTKQELVLKLLRRQNGASIAEIVEATEWQPHSVRGFLTAAVKKRLQIDVISEKDASGERRYYIAAIRP